MPLYLAAMIPRDVRPVSNAAAANTYRMIILLPGLSCINVLSPTVSTNSQNSPVNPC